MEYDLIGTVIDEIAAEGLSGITIPTLWIRLSSLKTLDVSSNNVRNYIWRSIICTETRKGTFQYYHLPSPRMPLVLYNRYEHMNPMTGTILEDPSLVPDDIYGEVTPVNDGDIRGSCADYKDRVNVTETVLERRLLLQQTMNEYGDERFVIVANQNQRNYFLFGDVNDPYLELTPLHYCILERIGRHRSNGETTIGKESGNYKVTPKTLFYYRKKLLKHKLIKKKLLIIMNTKTQQNSHGNVFTLSRLFVDSLTPMERNAREVCDILLSKHEHEMEFSQLKDKVQMTGKPMRALFAHFVNNFKVYDKRIINSEGKGTVVRFVKLIKILGDDDNDDDDQEDDDDDANESKNIASVKYDTLFNPGKILTDRPLLSQALAIVESCESADGMSLKDIGQSLSLPHLDARSLVRNLERAGEVTTMMVDRGRQKVVMYLPRCKSSDAKSIFDSARKSLNINANETVTQLKRANLILDYVNKVQIIDRIYTLRMLIKNSESDHRHEIDNKSVCRIVKKLASDGHLRSIKTILKFEDTCKKLHFVCVPSIASDHPLVKEKIEQFKFKLLNKQFRCVDVYSNKSFLNPQLLTSHITNSLSDKPSIELIYQPSIARKYGLEPKMKKLLTLYRFLFHLTYNDAKTHLNTDWRYYIQPLPKGNPSYTCTIGDIVPRMPLYIFVKIIWISHIIPGIEEYLNDPLKVSLTLSQLPPEIRQCLFYKRKFLFSICEILSGLSYLNLVMTETKEQHPKETTVITVKNNTVLSFDGKDESYTFNTIDDFERYADDLHYHCINPCTGCNIDSRLFAHIQRNWTYSPTTRVKLSHAAQRLKTLASNLIPIDRNENQNDNSKSKRKNVNSGPSVKRLCVDNSTSIALPTKIKRKKKKVPKKQCYDKIDLKAKRLLKKQRTDWTTEEDAFLLVCKITSTILDPHCHKFVCVDKKVIRDELHKYSPNISRDKTAMACHRRITYMLKYNPQIRQNVNDWVGEMLQDEQLVVKRPETGRTHQEAWNKAFVNLLHIVLNKIQSPYIQVSSDMTVDVNSIDALLSRFNIRSTQASIIPLKVALYEDARNIVDIYVNSVTNVLLSTLLSKSTLKSNDDSNYYSQTLFKIYQRYPDSLIRSVVAKMNKAGVMTKVKKTPDPNSLKTRGITPYKVSQSYLALLQTKMLIDSLVTDIPIDGEISIDDIKPGTSSAVVTDLLTSRCARFRTEVPDNVILLDDKCPVSWRNRKTNAKNIYDDPKCSSRYALHILHQRINSCPSDRISNAQDYLLINQCKVSCESNNFPKFPKEKVLAELNKQNHYIDDNEKPCDESLNRLLQFIKSKHELGASCDDIIALYAGVWPEEDLERLKQLNLVFRVGIRNFKWVYLKHVTPWLVHSAIGNGNAASDSGTILKNVKFIPRFWKRPDGSIDHNVLYKFLSGVLAHVMINPCITQSKLMEHYNRILQPVQLLEIIEILVAAECIEMILLEEVPKPKLFETDPVPSDYFVTHYEATADAFINLCRLKTFLVKEV